MTATVPVRLAAALAAAGLAPRRLAPSDLRVLPPAGVAHDHVAIAGTRLLLRVPRLSQTGRAAADNLGYQAACFTRAAPSGATPRLHAVLEPTPELPMGALLVDAIEGRPVRLPEDLPAIAACLGAIHGLPVPSEAAPLPVQPDPVAATLAVIAEQASWLDRADLHPDAVAAIEAEVAAAARARWPDIPHARTLVVVDTHPGNYVVDAAGKAWFVDLEKAAYGTPAIDVAHVTLPTSTGWDSRIAGTLSADDVDRFEAAWLAAVPAAVGAAAAPWLGPLRRLVWLRTVTWFARWRARSDAADDPWSAGDLPPALRTHLQAHVAGSLAPGMLTAMRAALPGFPG